MAKLRFTLIKSLVQDHAASTWALSVLLPLTFAFYNLGFRVLLMEGEKLLPHFSQFDPFSHPPTWSAIITFPESLAHFSARPQYDFRGTTTFWPCVVEIGR